MNAPRTIQVLALSAPTDELRPVASRLGQHHGLAWRAARDVAEVERMIEVEGWHPDLVVAYQSWPDQYSPEDVQRLLTVAPLARFVCVAGAWCDADGRTKPAWPLAVRIRTPLAEARFARELALLHGEAAADPESATVAGPLPLTASRAEIFAGDYSRAGPTDLQGLRLHVASRDRAFRAMIEAALRSRGAAVIGSLAAQPRVDAVVFDADPWDTSRHESCAALLAQAAGAPLIAAAGFATGDVAESLTSAGAAAVWFKLAPLDQLALLILAAASIPLA